MSCIHAQNAKKNHATEMDLNVHIAKVHGEQPSEEPQTCPICNQKFSSKRGLNIHKGMTHKVHPSEGPYTCLKCNEQFPTWIGLSEHDKIHWKNFRQTHKEHFIKK